MKKLYEIIKASGIITRNNGITEKETFTFLIEKDLKNFDIELKSHCMLTRQIDFYNMFCISDYIITKCIIEDFEFEKVGELWL